MKKYLGSSIDAFCAVIAPSILLGFLLFVISSFSTGIDIPRIILLIFCILCIIVWTVNLHRARIQLYSWGDFCAESVRVKPLFSKPFSIMYKNCSGCGIGYYKHGILNSQVGTRVCYIFLSYNKFDEKYRTRINLWHPTKTQIKVRFDKDLYDYLIEVLPKSSALALKNDYMKYMADRDNGK